MTPIIIIGVIVVVALVVYFTVLNKPSTPELPETEEPKKLPKKPAAAKDGKKKPAKAEPKPAPAEKSEPVAEETPPASEHEDGDEDFAEAEDDDEAEGEDEEAAPGGPPPKPLSRRARDVKGLRKGLKKVREEGGLFGRLKALFTGKKEIDPAIVDELEEILLTSDVGMKTTQVMIGHIRDALDKDEVEDEEAVWRQLRDTANEILDVGGDGPIRDHGQPTVVVMVGVNGTGKTTTIGKLATQFVEKGKSVLLVAGDTFRAAAVAQLQAWGERVGCDVFAGEDGADPASVVFDAIEHGKAQGVDLILVDTAGRLHTKSNLMDELKKVIRTCGKALDGAPHETLLVLDGTTGQNAMQQAAQFGETLELNGIVLTKLDGTAKGGVVLAIAHEHGLPVRYIGVGERAKDLRDFDSEEFVEAMLGGSGESARAA